MTQTAETFPIGWLKRIALVLLALFFIAAGANHFISPDFYLRMMPPWLPAHEAMNYLAGFFEMLGGAAVLIPAVRRYAGWGLIALLVAIFPANIHMAMNPGEFPELPRPLLYARLPFQLLFIAWVYWATRPDRHRDVDHAATEAA